jgi:hypothetical protein
MVSELEVVNTILPDVPLGTTAAANPSNPVPMMVAETPPIVAAVGAVPRSMDAHSTTRTRPANAEPKPAPVTVGLVPVELVLVALSTSAEVAIRPSRPTRDH